MSQYKDPMKPTGMGRHKGKIAVIVVLSLILGMVIVGLFVMVGKPRQASHHPRVSSLGESCVRGDDPGKMPITLGMLKKIEIGSNTYSLYPNVGPLAASRRVPSCYQNSKAGATVAAINIVEGINTPARLSIINQFFVGESLPQIRDLAKKNDPAKWSDREDTHVLAYKTVLEQGVWHVQLFASTDSGSTFLYSLYMQFIDGDMRMLADQSILSFRQPILRIPDGFQPIVEI